MVLTLVTLAGFVPKHGSLALYRKNPRKKAPKGLFGVLYVLGSVRTGAAPDTQRIGPAETVTLSRLVPYVTGIEITVHGSGQSRTLKVL
jgi:hypothetical protein